MRTAKEWRKELQARIETILGPPLAPWVTDELSEKWIAEIQADALETAALTCQDMECHYDEGSDAEQACFEGARLIRKLKPTEAT